MLTSPTRPGKPNRILSIPVDSGLRQGHWEYTSCLADHQRKVSPPKQLQVVENTPGLGVNPVAEQEQAHRLSGFRDSRLNRSPDKYAASS